MKTKLALLLLAAGSLLYAQENNLVRNGKIDQKPSKTTNGLPEGCLAVNAPGWGHWNAKGSEGKVWQFNGKNAGFDDDFAILVKNMKQGCVLQSIKVEAGKEYTVKSICKKTGSAKVTLTVGWQNEKGGWAYHKFNQNTEFSKTLKDGWHEASATVKVPDGARWLALMANIQNQSGEDVCWFDNFMVSLSK